MHSVTCSDKLRKCCRLAAQLYSRRRHVLSVFRVNVLSFNSTGTLLSDYIYHERKLNSQGQKYRTSEQEGKYSYLNKRFYISLFVIYLTSRRIVRLLMDNELETIPKESIVA
jgi:hypothetical protein